MTLSCIMSFIGWFLLLLFADAKYCFFLLAAMSRLSVHILTQPSPRMDRSPWVDKRQGLFYRHGKEREHSRVFECESERVNCEQSRVSIGWWGIEDTQRPWLCSLVIPPLIDWNPTGGKEGPLFAFCCLFNIGRSHWYWIQASQILSSM